MADVPIDLANGPKARGDMTCKPGCVCGKHRANGHTTHFQDALGWSERGEPLWFYWTEARIIAAFKRYARTHGGRPPTSKVTNGEGLRQAPLTAFPRPDMPTHNTVRHFFGSWNAAIKAADLTPRSRAGQRRYFYDRKGNRRWVSA